MNRLLLGLSALAALFAPVHASDSESADQLRVARVLLPETRSWQSVDSLPCPETKALLRDRWLLRSTYLKSGQNGLMEDPDCSFILRALWEHVDEPLFRLADFDGDGLEDVVYSGPAQCREGHAAVIWFGKQRGIVRQDVSVIFGRLLAAEMRGQRRLSAIRVGCCDDPVDEYAVLDVRAQQLGARHRIHKATRMPEAMKLADEAFAAGGPLVLRSAPTMDYRYKPGATDSITGARLTEVAARYAPGAKGAVVARFKDAKGKRWRLVVIDEASRSLCTEGEGGVNVGWILGD